MPQQHQARQGKVIDQRTCAKEESARVATFTLALASQGPPDQGRRGNHPR
jgi:hypothetical protein